ncbi:MAG: hypothetical protein Q4B70_10265 [Lachnospiraceae bacterium]|nr:hypothetical protein [Lachnospiraceae bacterium]
MKTQRKNMFKFMFVLLTCIFLVSGCRGNYVSNNQSTDIELPESQMTTQTSEYNIEDELSEKIENGRVVIYTYSGERYEGLGRLEVVQDGSEHPEIVLELEGSLVNHGPFDQEQIPEEVMSDVDKSTVVTVYDDNQVYGFFSTNGLHIHEEEEYDVVEVYGYLEGFYDGEVDYST